MLKVNALAVGAVLVVCLPALAQTAADAAKTPTLRDRIMADVNPPPGAWNANQIQDMERLRDAALHDSYAQNQLRYLTDNIGPRLTGSPQAQQAVEYVASEMRALGAHVQLEKTTVPHWVRGSETGELVTWPGQPPGTTQKIVLTALGGSAATAPDGLTAGVIVVKSFDELKQLPRGSADGKIVLFDERFDKRLAAQGYGGEAYGQAVVYRAAGPVAGAQAGAAAVLVRSVGGADFRLPHTGATLYADDVVKIPAAAVAAEDADLLEHLTSQGPVRMHLQLTPQTLPPVESFNVLADWPGSEHPEQIVVVSGHLDSWDLGTGAIDDAAGVAVSMQAIHLLKQLGIHPKRTIRFVAWMNEENGTDGAKTYAAEHEAEMVNHAGAIESDLGAGHPGGITFAGKPELANWLRPVADVLRPAGAGALVPGREVGSDIDFLTEKGVPGFTPAQDSRFYFNYHHTAADTFDKVDPRELNENAAVMTVLSYALADADGAAPR